MWEAYLRSLRVVALVMGFALIPLPFAHAALAAAASSLFEALPFLLATALPVLGPHRPWLLDLAGCGCGHGRAARSLPGAILASMVLGPPIAAARFGVAWLIPQSRPAPHPAAAAGPLAALDDYLPFALAGAATVTFIPSLAPEVSTLPCPLALLAGAGLAFVAAPCAFGAVTLGAALLHLSPALGAGWLALAGLCDLRALRSRVSHPRPMGRMAACAILAALAVVVARHGATLINPRFLPLLALSAVALAWKIPTLPATRSGITCAALMVIAALCAHAPTTLAPANATSLSGAFAGQPFSMIGQIARSHGATYITRQAMTCCRADAAPISLRIITAEGPTNAAWVQVSGVLAVSEGELALARPKIRMVPAPQDPYVYR